MPWAGELPPSALVPISHLVTLPEVLARSSKPTVVAVVVGAVTKPLNPKPRGCGDAAGCCSSSTDVATATARGATASCLR